MNAEPEFYLPGEERFGYFSSRFYGLFSRSSPMRKFHRFVVENISERNPSSALDVGFGTGEVLRQLCRRDEIPELFGVEPSTQMIEIAQRKLRDCITSGKAELKKGNSREIPFDRKFDLIFSSLSFHHWKEQEKSIESVLSHLNPGGSFIVFEFGKELLQGYKKITSGHALSLDDVERFRKNSPLTMHDSGEYRYVEFHR